MDVMTFDAKEIFRQATRQFLSGNPTEALALVSQLVEKKLELEAALRLQATCFYQLQRLDEAVDALNKLLLINNTHADDYFNLGLIYKLKNQLDLAESTYKKGIAINPENSNAQLGLADVYIQKHESEKAVELLNQFLEKHPDNITAGYKLATISEDSEKVISALTTITQKKPCNANAHTALAKIFLDKADLTHTAYHLNEALAISNNSSLPHYFSGIYSFRTKQFSVATEYFLNALKISPDQAEIHVDLAKNYLAQGNFDDGWNAFEWRRKLAHNTASLFADILRWHGQSLTNKHLLIFAEINYGLTFLFARYLRSIKLPDNKITLIVPPEQIEVIKQLNLVDDVISARQEISHPADYVASLLSIPYIKKLDYGQVTLLNEDKPPKLEPPNSLIFKKVGLCWKQSDDVVYANLNKVTTSILTPLIMSVEAEIYCLHPTQLDNEEQEWCHNNKIILLPNLNKPDILLKIINDLDLIITTDHEIAHMAASMNKPTWVLVPFASSWYFGISEQKTPWYPSMQLFRERELNDWSRSIFDIIVILSNYAKRTSFHPMHPEQLLINTANELNSNGKYQECIDFCKPFLLKYPKSPAFYYFIGTSAGFIQQNELAISHLLHADRLNNKSANICINLGTIYYRLNQTDKAIESLKRALDLAPDNTECLKNLAIIYFELGFPEESSALYKKILSLKDSVDHHFSYSLQLLGNGHYEEGWREYEYRIYLPTHTYRMLKVPSPMWDGSNLDGKTIFLVTEQGLGDNIQFFRFIKLLKQQYDCKILLGCNSNLLRLVKQFDAIDTIICENEHIPSHDYHLPLLSLAMHLKINDESQFMSNEPYIMAHPKLSVFWKSYFQPVKTIKIGFCWSGNAQHVNNLRRNCTLFDFIQLLYNKNISLFSLQKNITPEEKILLTGAGIDNLGEIFKDLADTAAVIDQLDLVISIDSSMAHLAGAMGKKTWLLLPYYIEWRHRRDREYSPWYKDVKFYRQPKPGDWRSVFSRIVDDLAKL